MEKRYRPNVAIVIVDDKGLLLACERSDIAGVWQIPQGGIEDGEEIEQAMFRELVEEIGTAQVSVIGKLASTLKYDWPPELYSRGFHGQEQTYFLVRADTDIKFKLKQDGYDQEFSKVEWLTMKQFISRVSGFKVQTYQNAISLLNDQFPGIIKLE